MAKRNVACEVHGPLRWHGDAVLPEGGPGAWTCPGFDGEGCLNIGPFPLPDASYRRVASGIARWPGTVVLPDGAVP
jgi:hypothetical protein